VECTLHVSLLVIKKVNVTIGWQELLGETLNFNKYTAISFINI